MRGICRTPLAVFPRSTGRYGGKGVGRSDDEEEKIFNRKQVVRLGYALFISQGILSITEVSIRRTGTPEKGARSGTRVPNGEYHFLNGV